VQWRRHGIAVAQRSGILGQVVYRCHNGQIVTLNN